MDNNELSNEEITYAFRIVMCECCGSDNEAEGVFDHIVKTKSPDIEKAAVQVVTEHHDYGQDYNDGDTFVLEEKSGQMITITDEFSINF